MRYTGQAEREKHVDARQMNNSHVNKYMYMDS